MSELEEIKKALGSATKGEDWTNFDDSGYSKTVYEYDRLTENTCDIIAECKSVEMAEFIANAPEWLRYLVGAYEKSERANRGLGVICDNLQTEAERLEDQIKELQKALEEVRNAVFDEFVPVRLSAKVHQIVDQALKGESK